MALKGLSRLAAITRSRQDELLEEAPAPLARDRVRHIRARRDERQRRQKIRVAAGAAMLAAAAGFGGLYLVPQPAAFEVGTDRAAGATGVWLTTPPSQEIPLYFPDGSRMIMLDDARFQVQRVKTTGAEVVVEKGKVRASVVSRPENDWLVVVGPFQVQVRGTQFDASWDPDRRRFRLRMRKGEVVVRGGCLDGTRSAANQESFEITCPLGDSEDVIPAAPAVSASAPIPAVSSSAASVGARGEGEAPPVGPAWRKLMEDHDARGAIDLIEANGTFDTTCETAPVGDLQMLANAARHAGRPQRANQVYQTIRRRFPGGDAAANSAFHLGRLALVASPQRARMWLSTYLAERPHGALAQEALGRILEIDQGDPVQGAETARRYLAQFPHGPHAGLARSVLFRSAAASSSSKP